MFSCNQIFVVTGDNDELLKDIISLLIKQMSPIVGYNILEDSMNIYVLTYNDKMKTIKKENASNVDYIYYLVKTYLSSYEYYKAMDKYLLDNPYSGYDGVACSGWKIEIQQENYRNVISIKPFKTFCSK